MPLSNSRSRSILPGLLAVVLCMFCSQVSRAQDAPTTVPLLLSFSINDGATVTNSRNVNLFNEATQSPTEYIASEQSGFGDATWQPYDTAPAFTLSAGNGDKTVFLKVRNALGESESAADTIILDEPLPPYIKTFDIDFGSTITYDRTVTLFNETEEEPTEYMASELLDFSDTDWQTYPEPPDYPVLQLEASVGLHTVYFITRNEIGESNVVNDSIELRTQGNLPGLDWGSYLGGALEDESHAVACDSAGNVFVAGRTWSPDWVADGADLELDAWDGFVAKFDPDGNHLWSSYVGGRKVDAAYGATALPSGDVVVVGMTRSPDWVQGPGDSEFGGKSPSYRPDGFAAQFDPDGLHVWSRYLGGAEDDWAWDVEANDSGQLFVVGDTWSPGWLLGNWDNVLNDGVTPDPDGFLVKLSSVGNDIWGTYVGGKREDHAYGLALDTDGAVVMTGKTYSNDGWISGIFQDESNGGFDAYLAKVSGGGQHLWSTYFGGEGQDVGWDVVVDSQDYPVLVGHTDSLNLAHEGSNNALNNGESLLFDDGFVARFSRGGWRIWSTYVGGARHDSARGVEVDGVGHIYVTGDTNSGDWVWNSWDDTLNDGMESLPNDAFVAKYDLLGQHVWSSYLGGAGDDHAYDVAVDPAFNLFIAGYSSSTGWLTGGWDTVYNGGKDGFVHKIDNESVLSFFALNNGSPMTGERRVTLDNAVAGGASQFLASESPDFAGAAWQNYTSAPDFELSAGEAVKTVYFKVRQGGQESAVVSDSIVLTDTVFTLTYRVEGEGSLLGEAVQSVAYGASGSAVQAVPAPGHRFLGWSDGAQGALRQESSVTENLDLTARFGRAETDAEAWPLFR